MNGTVRRTAMHPERPPSGRMVEVVLARLPLADLVTSRDHHAAVLRELALVDCDAPEDRCDGSEARSDRPRGAPEGVLCAVAALREQARFLAGPVRQVDEALARGEEAIDLRLVLPVEVGETAATLIDLLRMVDRWCAQGRLVTPPPPPAVVRFREWLLGQLVAQSVGGAPTLFGSEAG